MICDDTTREIHDSWDRRMGSGSCFIALTKKCKACNMYIMYEEE